MLSDLYNAAAATRDMTILTRKVPLDSWTEVAAWAEKDGKDRGKEHSSLEIKRRDSCRVGRKGVRGSHKGCMEKTCYQAGGKRGV